MTLIEKTVAAATREAWLKSLKVGDKITRTRFGDSDPVDVYVIERETRTCWVIKTDWLVSKTTGKTKNIITGVNMRAYSPEDDKEIKRRERAQAAADKRQDLINVISKFSMARLQRIVDQHRHRYTGRGKSANATIARAVAADKRARKA